MKQSMQGKPEEKQIILMKRHDDTVPNFLVIQNPFGSENQN
jgi:hypothetical protein